MECVCDNEQVRGRCALPGCEGIWSVTGERVKSECFVHSPRICGGHARLCKDCTSNGYTVSSGIGDGLVRVYRKTSEENPTLVHEGNEKNYRL